LGRRPSPDQQGERRRGAHIPTVAAARRATTPTPAAAMLTAASMMFVSKDLQYNVGRQLELNCVISDTFFIYSQFFCVFDVKV
jgi:hypothetical protein